MTKDTDQEIGQTKRCSKCGDVKLLNLFSSDKRIRGGRASECKECIRVRDRIYREKNAVTIAKRKRVTRSKNIESERARGRERAKNNRPAVRERFIRWYAANSSRVVAAAKEWSDKNIDKRRAIRRKYNRSLRSTEMGRLSSNISRALSRSLNGKKCEVGAFEMLPYTKKELVSHLERQFSPGMTWENYGEWHVDHIVPIAAHHYIDHQHPDFVACWSLTNLRPLWASENQSKGKKIISFL